MQNSNLGKDHIHFFACNWVWICISRNIFSQESEHTKFNIVSSLFFNNGSPIYSCRILLFKEKVKEGPFYTVKSVHTPNKHRFMMQMQTLISEWIPFIPLSQLNQLFSCFIQCFWKTSYPDELNDVVAPLLKCQQSALREMFTQALLAGHGSRKLDWACIQGRAYTENAAVVLSCDLILILGHTDINRNLKI